MKTSEIYLLTAFVCSACDGDIAPKEIALLKDWSDKSKLFGNVDVEAKLNEYVDSINEHGNLFIKEFLLVLASNVFTEEEQLQIIRIAIEMIVADGLTLYSEVKFFKKLRSCLSISDNAILNVLPDKEDYLLPDIKTSDFIFDEDIKFERISLGTFI
ncbi:MAG: TerB family tellurite resistance protein [Bacteroides sp.]|nr:TerB family tellurite resistance protein [Bacteroides sp.]